MDFKIRNANFPKDMDFFRELDFQSYKVTFYRPGITDTEFKKNYEKFREFYPFNKEIIDHQIFIVENQFGYRVGLVWVAPFNQFKADSAWIYNLHVITAFRGKGLGKELLEKAEEWAKNHNFRFIGLHVVKHNQIARNLYESMGYRLIDQLNESCVYEKKI